MDKLATALAIVQAVQNIEDGIVVGGNPDMTVEIIAPIAAVAVAAGTDFGLVAKAHYLDLSDFRKDFEV